MNEPREDRQDQPPREEMNVCLSVDGDVVSVDDARSLSRKHECCVFAIVFLDAMFLFLLRPPNNLPSLSLACALPSQNPPTLFLAGFALLPWAWALNAWIFYPVAFGSSVSSHSSSSPSIVIDPVVRRNARASALLAAASGVALLSWAAAFSLGGPRVVGEETFDRLNLGDLDLEAYGL